MKTGPNSSPTAAVAARRQPPQRRLRLRGGNLDQAAAAERRAQHKAGAYKRVEVYLGVEAAIALRQLMRDGRSAREVIEALLLAERRRKAEAR
jgi:hypothetical protein